VKTGLVKTGLTKLKKKTEISFLNYKKMNNATSNFV